VVDLEKAEYLNVGSGKVRYPNCINLDISANRFTKPDIVGSVLDIPFPDERFKGVIFSHVLEHLFQVEHVRAMMEIWRVLKKDEGKLFLEVPDFLLACKYYYDNHQGRRDYWYQCIYGKKDYLSDVHKSGIDQVYLTDLLFTCGFGHLRWIDWLTEEPSLVVVAEKVPIPWGKV
jgi:predicted SAM-dependent methyltransferase